MNKILKAKFYFNNNQTKKAKFFALRILAY